MTKSTIPHYETDEEIAAARAMHGAHYDRLVARKQIIGPSTTELPQSELDQRLAAKTERKAAKKKSTRSRAKKSAKKHG